MVFSSLIFLFRFLPAVLLAYYIAPPKLKNLVLFLFSLVFYSWGEMKYFPVMMVLITINYTAGILMDKFKHSEKMRKAALIYSVVGSLSMLLFFKYTDFFLSNINALFGTSFPLLRLTLPLGISFYTFQTMSYAIDVYRGDAATEYSFIDFGAYVVMFPQLIAGPIVKYREVAERLKVLKGRVDLHRVEEGISLFVYGLAKKVLIANNIGALWTEVEKLGFANISTPLAWLGILAFGLQIYFDFSGYSLMGIGMGKMLGFDFLQNFDLPYISRSVTEFWRRWHMSLGSWFREYVYIPLGGNRKGLGRQIVNLFIVWFLTGFWHGANWNFIFWGLYYFLLLTLEKIWLLPHLQKGKVWPHLYTLFAVLMGWVLFAVIEIPDLALYFGKLFVPQGGISAGYFLRNYGLALAVGTLMSSPVPARINEVLQKRAALRVAVVAVLLVLSVAYLVDSTYNPFLYFRF